MIAMSKLRRKRFRSLFVVRDSRSEQFKKNSRQPTRKLLRFALYASCELIRYVDKFMAIVLLFKGNVWQFSRAREEKTVHNCWKTETLDHNAKQSSTCACNSNINEIEKAHLTIFL